jgi:hypothetical protein
MAEPGEERMHQEGIDLVVLGNEDGKPAFRRI